MALGSRSNYPSTFTGQYPYAPRTVQMLVTNQSRSGVEPGTFNCWSMKGVQCLAFYVFKRESLLWAGASQWRIYCHRMWGQLSTTCSNLLKYPNGELLVAVDHNQLWTMASEKVDSIDWSHPPPSWAVPPDHLVHSINRCSSATAGIRSWNVATFSMRGNHLAYAATQGIIPDT